MIKRHIIRALEEWRISRTRRPLILRGARQVGKTTAVLEFSKEFDTFLHLNLEKHGDRELFERTDSVSDLLDEIYLYLKKNKQQGSTLLFIDEIQNSAAAIAMLRYFYEDIPRLHVVAAGSLLENLVDVNRSFPVGRVEYMAVRPCSFLEFLDGIGEDFDARAISEMKAHSVHERMMKHFRQYVLVGGMPAVIDEYARNRDLLAVNPIYEALITSYIDDSIKYAVNKSQGELLSQMLSAGWAEAAETITFKGFAGTNYGSREVSEALHTLERAMLMELVYPVVEPKVPLVANRKRHPKLIWFDTGLVNFQAGIRRELFMTPEVMDMWRGRVGEQIVAQELIAYNTSVLARRYFWSRDRKDGNAEVDFVIQHGSHVVPVEVKTGLNSKLKSLHRFMEYSIHGLGVRIWSGPLSKDMVRTPSGKTFTLVNVPFYYISQLERILDECIYPQMGAGDGRGTIRD